MADNPGALIGRDMLKDFFAKIGLNDPSVIGEVDKLFTAGVTNVEQILFSLRENAKVKERFDSGAMDAYNKRTGQNLSFAGYVALENQYKEALTGSGLPQDFINHYTSPKELSGFIARNTSANELTTRVNNAKYAAQSMDSNAKKILREYYGVDSDHAAAYFLNPQVAGDILDKNFKAMQLGAQGANAGLGISKNIAESAADSQQFQQGMSQLQNVGSQSDPLQRLNGLYGDVITDDDLVSEAFNLDGAANVSKKKKTFASKERAAFGGSSGVNAGSLAQKRTAV